MAEVINKTWLLYKITIIWAVLLSLNALGTCIMIALQNAQWSMLNGQAKFLMVVAIWVNWSGAMIALAINSAKKIESGKLPFDNGNTEQFNKNENKLVAP